MSNNLGSIYARTVNGTKRIIIDSDSVDVSGNFFINGTNSRMPAEFENSIRNYLPLTYGTTSSNTNTLFDIISEVSNNLLTSNNDASFGNVDISGNLNVNGTLTPTEFIMPSILQFPGNGKNISISRNSTTYRTSDTGLHFTNIEKIIGPGIHSLTFENSTSGSGEDTKCVISLSHNLNISTNNINEPISAERGHIILSADHGEVRLDSYNGTTVSSDNRIKHNEIDIINGLKIIRQLKPQKYQKTKELYEENYNGDISGRYYIESGFIAQDILKIEDLSYCVKGGDYIDENNNNIINKYYLAYQDIFVYNVAAVKELDLIVQNQQTEINELKVENLLLKQENTLIKSKLNEILSEMGKETI